MRMNPFLVLSLVLLFLTGEPSVFVMVGLALILSACIPSAKPPTG